jgi:hypothetical protein
MSAFQKFFGSNSARQACIFAAVVVGMQVLAGCGAGRPAFQEVSGRVVFRKQPLRKGLIEFVAAGPGASGAGTVIRDGQYTVRPEAGLSPGNYRVKIVPNVPSRIDWEDSAARQQSAAQKVQIPEKYNVKTVLTAEVKSDGKQTIDFELD